LLEASASLAVAMHLFIGSKASWEPIPASGTLHEEMPAFADVLKDLRA